MWESFIPCKKLPLLPGGKVTNRDGTVISDDVDEISEYVDAELKSFAPPKVHITKHDSRTSTDPELQELAKTHFGSVESLRCIDNIRNYLSDYYKVLQRGGAVGGWGDELRGPFESKQDFIDEVVINNHFAFDITPSGINEPNMLRRRIHLVVGIDEEAVPNIEEWPTSPLGTPYAERLLNGKLECGIVSHADQQTPLITLQVDRKNFTMDIWSFFNDCEPDIITQARATAKTSGGRTLGGLGMQWVKEVAVFFKITDISLLDLYKGGDGSRSENLQNAALAALGLQGRKSRKIHRRAVRAAPRGVLPGSAFKKAYFERVAKGGYYGQWGFTDAGYGSFRKKVRVDDMVDVNAAFVDLQVC